jgi:hypothetical protein
MGFDFRGQSVRPLIDTTNGEPMGGHFCRNFARTSPEK